VGRKHLWPSDDKNLTPQDLAIPSLGRKHMVEDVELLLAIRQLLYIRPYFYQMHFLRLSTKVI
jgi:hypothetical protein